MPENKQTKTLLWPLPETLRKRVEGHKVYFLYFTKCYISLTYLYSKSDFWWTKSIFCPWKIRVLYFSGKTRVDQYAINCHGCSSARRLIRWDMTARIIWASYFWGCRRRQKIPASEKNFCKSQLQRNNLIILHKWVNMKCSLLSMRKDLPLGHCFSYNVFGVVPIILFYVVLHVIL